MLRPKYSSLTMAEAIELYLKSAGKPVSVQDMALDMFELELESEMKYVYASLYTNLTRGKKDNKWRIASKGLWESVDTENAGQTKQLSIADAAA